MDVATELKIKVQKNIFDSSLKNIEKAFLANDESSKSIIKYNRELMELASFNISNIIKENNK